MDLRYLIRSQIVYNPAINARGDTPTDISEIKATIIAQGIGQALLVRVADDGVSFEPVDGGRRFRAICELIDQGALPADHRIPCIVRELRDEQALELSLATAVTRLPLNPADEAVSFQRLLNAGTRPSEIAARFGVTERRVRQRLAISGLPAEIISALRNGEISVEVAEAYTVAHNIRNALALFKKSAGGYSPNWIRKSLNEKRVSANSPECRFIGLDAYRSAGGAVDEDLFSNDVWLADGKLLMRLFNEKIEAYMARLKAEGWSFVLLEPMPYGGKTSRFLKIAPEGNRTLSKSEKARVHEIEAEIKRLRKTPGKGDSDTLGETIADLELELFSFREKPFTDAQKSRTGVIINIPHNEVEFLFGMMEPRQEKKEASQKAADRRDDGEEGSPRPEPEADFSAGLSFEMAEVMTKELQGAIPDNPGMARRLVAAVLLAVVAGDLGVSRLSMLQVRRQDLRTNPGTAAAISEIAAQFQDRDGLKPLGAIFAGVTGWTDARVDNAIALCLAATLNFNAVITAEDRPIIDAFDLFIAWRPNEEFFKRLPKETLLAALGEAAVMDAKATKKKGELVAMALRHLVPDGWLPTPLRTPSYAGPGSNAWADARPLPQAAE